MSVVELLGVEIRFERDEMMSKITTRMAVTQPATRRDADVAPRFELLLVRRKLRLIVTA